MRLASHSLTTGTALAVGGHAARWRVKRTAASPPPSGAVRLWYRYEPASRAPIPDSVIDELIAGVSAGLGTERHAVSADGIVLGIAPRLL